MLNAFYARLSSIQDWAKRAFDPTVELITDGFGSLGAAASVVATHGAIIVTPHRSSDLTPFQWINTIISNLKTAIRGTYHHLNFRKYGQRYLAEPAYRLNRRFDLSGAILGANGAFADPESRPYEIHPADLCRRILAAKWWI